MRRHSEGDYIVQGLAPQTPTCLVSHAAKAGQPESLQREIVGATRERMLREIAEALETIAAECPLLLVLEDLQ